MSVLQPDENRTRHVVPGYFCRECKCPLTLVEVHFYGDRCEPCEARWLERVES